MKFLTLQIIFETAEARRTLADIEERHQQLLKIERMLVEVRDMFLQIGILVDAQVVTYFQKFSVTIPTYIL